MDIEGSLTEIVEAGSAWITDAGEVLAIARYHGGNRDFLVFDDPEALGTWVSSLPADTNLLVLKDYELGIRGAATDVIHQIPEEADVEWLMIVEGVGYQSRDEAWECSGTAEVLEHVSDYDTEYVIIGRMPGWNPAATPHAPDTLSAIVPRADGTVQRGIY